MAGRRWGDLLVLASYVVLSLAMCYPLLSNMTTHVAGRGVDTRIFQWNNWWVKDSLLNARNPNYTESLYYPSGVSLASHNVNWVSSVIAVPLDLLFGPVPAYNITFLATFFLSAFVMYLLVRHLTGRRDAAFLAGLVFAFSQYHVSGNWDGQMNLANIQWIPLFALFFLRTIRDQKVKDALWAGVFAALASLDCWFFAIFAGMWAALVLLYDLATRWRHWNGRLVRLILLASVVAAGLVSPFLLPVLTESAGGSLGSALDYHAAEKSTDLLAFVTPSSDHPLLGRLAAPLYEQFRHWRPAFLGYAALLLAGYAAFVSRRKAAIWLLTGACFASLALGTTLNVNGVEYPGVPMPYRLLTSWVPALKIIRQANRFNVMVALSLAVLVGLGCADLLDRLGKLRSGRMAWTRWGLVGVVGALLLFEYLAFPCPLQSAQVSPFYRALATEEGNFAILELPIDDFHSRQSLYPQTVHGKPLVNGYVARTPAEAQAFINQNAVLKKLRIQVEIDPALHDIPADLAVLAANDIRYVVIHKQALPPQPAVDEGVLASWRELFGPVALYEDDEIVVFRLLPDPDIHLAAPLRIADRLGLVHIDARRTQLPSGQQSLAVDLAWTALEDLSRDYMCSLSLSKGGEMVSATAPEPISPRYPPSRWPQGVAVAEQYAVPVDPSLPAGEYALTLRVTDATSGQEVGTLEQPVSIAGQAEALVPALEDMAFAADVTFGDKMHLLGYTARQEESHLIVQMAWQGVQTMETNYKISLQLLRPADGQVVAQVDTMPRNWSYPTSSWGRREVFVDWMELEIEGIEAGEYQLAVGVYDPDGAGRLAAVGAGGQTFAEDRAILEHTVEVQAP